MIDWLSGDRITSMRYVRVSWPGYAELGPIDGVTGCKLSESMFSDLKVTGSLDYAGMPDLGDDMVRVYSDHEQGGERETVCHATLFVSTPSSKVKEGVSDGTAEMYSVLLSLRDVECEQTVTVEASRNAVARAAELAAACGARVAATPSAYLTTTSHSWPAGTSYLKIVNELLDFAGYSAATVDAYGSVVMAPYEDASGKAEAACFSDTTASVTESAIEHEIDRYSVPNKVIVVCSNADNEPVVGVAVNDDPESPYSTVSRGRVVCRSETVSDLDGQEAADRKARDLLNEGMSVVESVTFRHAWMDFRIGDAVGCDFRRSGITGKMTAVSRDVEMTSDLGCETRARRFANLWEV